MTALHRGGSVNNREVSMRACVCAPCVHFSISMATRAVLYLLALISAPPPFLVVLAL
jgi:hypothetical protein